MDALWTWLESLGISQYVGESAWFPLLESIHVVAATFLVGTIAMLDLRLIGLAAVHHRISRISQEIVPWTMSAAVVAVTTGVPLFSTRANHYAHNTAFQFKLVFLLLAGVNMLWFHFQTSKTMAEWDEAARPVTGARMAGMCSMFVWTGVLLSGRWIGHLI